MAGKLYGKMINRADELPVEVAVGRIRLLNALCIKSC